jgi:hypothetical protein
MLFDWLGRGDWLTRKRVIVLSIMLLAFELAVLGFLVAGSYGWVQAYGPKNFSFVGFYAGGRLAVEGHPEFAYDEALYHEEQEILAGPGINFLSFLYPPVYLLLCAPLAMLPFLPALIVFEGTTLIIYLLVVRRILDAPGSGWLLPALAFPPTIWTIGYGQNGFLTAALLGAGTLAIDRRPALAGMLFGALCYKPHFALLVPVALVAGKRWPAVIGAAVSVSGLVGISVALFGWETWHLYFREFFGSAETYEFELTHVNIFASISPFAGARLLGLSLAHARIVQLAATVFAMLLVGWVWGTKTSSPTRAAVLVASTLIAVPYALLYDLIIAAVAGSWIIRAGRDSGFLRWEKAGLTAIYLLPLFAFQAGMILRLPLVPVAGALLVLLCASRAWQEHGGSRAHAISAV